MLAEVFSILWTYRQGFLSGLKVTIQLALIIWICGIIIGSFLGWLGARYRFTVGLPCRVISFILSGVPVLVFLFWLHYPAQSVFDLAIDPFYTSALTFTIINIFAISDLVRVHVLEFPQQYILAAQVCGLTPQQTILRIQLPIILRHILPSLLMLQVTMLHFTLFASLISVEEIFRVAQRINSAIYKPIEIYSALGIFFLAVSLPINGLALFIKHRFTRNLSEK